MNSRFSRCQSWLSNSNEEFDPSRREDGLRRVGALGYPVGAATTELNCELL